MKKTTYGSKERGIGGPHLSHILQHSHPGQLLLDHSKVMNFVSKLSTISSIVHLEESTCTSVVLPRRGDWA
jgi:hypothetical protein